jgi:DNA-binding beta-propeller fold protein YncE
MSAVLDENPLLGGGRFTYVDDPDWARLPTGWRFHNVAGLGIDSRDNVYVFDRGPHPVMVFDRNGDFLRAWGEGDFKRPHAVHVAPDDTVWLTDDSNHVVRQYTPDGKLLLSLGQAGHSSAYMSGLPFNKCTHTAMSPQGDIYVSDGYGNARVHKYAPDGRLLLSWGGPGTMPGEFNIPHNITCDGDGWVYVADRENHRVQVFDGNGRYETQWNNLHKPCGMYMRPGKCPCCYIAEAGAHHAMVNRDMPNIGPRISILDHQGNLLARFGHLRKGNGGPAHFLGLHAIAVDSAGVIYVADLAVQTWKRFNPDRDDVPLLPSLHRFRPVQDG